MPRAPSKREDFAITAYYWKEYTMPPVYGEEYQDAHTGKNIVRNDVRDSSLKNASTIVEVSKPKRGSLPEKNIPRGMDAVLATDLIEKSLAYALEKNRVLLKSMSRNTYPDTYDDVLQIQRSLVYAMRKLSTYYHMEFNEAQAPP